MVTIIYNNGMIKVKRKKQTDKTVCDECAVFERVSGDAISPGSLLRERGCSK